MNHHHHHHIIIANACVIQSTDILTVFVVIGHQFGSTIGKMDKNTQTNKQRDRYRKKKLTKYGDNEGRKKKQRR